MVPYRPPPSGVASFATRSFKQFAAMGRNHATSGPRVTWQRADNPRRARQYRAHRHRHVAIGRLSRRIEPHVQHSCEDVAVFVPSRERVVGVRDGEGLIHQLDTRETSATATTRHCCKTPQATYPRARANTCSLCSTTCCTHRTSRRTSTASRTRGLSSWRWKHISRSSKSGSRATKSIARTRRSSPARRPKSRRPAGSTTPPSAPARAARSPRR